jgi:hypothetical protein
MRTGHGEKHMKTEFVTARYDLTDEEKREMGMDVAEALAEAEELKAQLDAVKKDFNSRIKTAELRASNVAGKLRSGYEMREFECVKHVDPETRMVEYIGIHTGEVLKRRPAEQADLQLTFEEEEPPAETEEAREDEGTGFPPPDKKPRPKSRRKPQAQETATT